MGCCNTKDTTGYAGSSQPPNARSHTATKQQVAVGSNTIRPSQRDRPTIDPATGLPFKKDKKKKKKTADVPTPTMTKQCAQCNTTGTLFTKENFDYCSTACMKAHASTPEFLSRFQKNEAVRNA